MPLATLTVLAALTAQEAATTEGQNPEIVVTGERVTRSVRRTPSSVAVVEEDDLESNGANRVDQALLMIPNVQVGNGSQGPAIRGIDTTGPLSALPAFLGGNRPKMALVVDGRPVSYNEFVFGSFPVWDVERLEIFRSPQTTTQGQNSIAGAIFVNTNDPTLSPEYRARAIVGDLKMRQVSALVSGPVLGDDVAFRVAGDFRYSRTTSKITDKIRGGDPSHDVYGLLRGKLLFTPAAGTQVELAYVHSQSQAPQAVGLIAPFRKRRDTEGFYGTFQINVDSVTASVRQQASEALTASVTLSAGDSSARRLAIPDFGETRNDGSDRSAEAVLNWSPGGPFSLVAGASHNHVRLKQFINLKRLSGSVGRFHDWQDGTGVFAEASLALSSQATLTAGLRYQRDRQKRLGALTAETFVIPVDFIGVFDEWLPKVTLAYDVTPDVRVGALIQKAYNPGGTTIRIDTGRPDEFKAESLWDYEVFARGKFAGGLGTVSANLFYYDMKDAQRADPIFVPVPGGLNAGFARLFNVPEARSYGAEAEVSWKLSRAVSTRFSAGILRTKIVETDGESVALAGHEFERSPHFTLAAALDFTPTERIRLAAQVRHRSRYYTDPENSRNIRVGSANNLDIRGEYRIGDVKIFGQIRNVFDAVNMLDLADVDYGEAEDQRNFAIGLESRF